MSDINPDVTAPSPDDAVSQFSTRFDQVLVSPSQWWITLIGAKQLFEMDETSLFWMALVIVLYFGAYYWTVHGDPDLRYACIVADYVVPVLGYLFFGLIVNSILSGPFKWVIICLFPVVMMLTSPHHKQLYKGIQTVLKNIAGKFHIRGGSTAPTDSASPDQDAGASVKNGSDTI